MPLRELIVGNGLNKCQRSSGSAFEIRGVRVNEAKNNIEEIMNNFRVLMVYPPPPSKNKAWHRFIGARLYDFLSTSLPPP
jgi:hypothetical protein